MKIENLSKRFYGSHALEDVSIEFYAGEVHVVCGENGAGKSTLMKILSGMYTRDKGSILLFGKPFFTNSPAESEKHGIVTIYQEFNLSPSISVAENIFLHREPGKFLVDRKELRKQAEKYLEMIGCKVSPNEKVSLLSTANQQMVQIAKALSQNAKILIMDEPCSSITEDDTEVLFALIRKLKETGITIIYIDHRIENFKKIGDRVSVLRDGSLIGTKNIEDTTKDEIISMMVGRSLSETYPKTSTPQEETLFEIRNFTNRKLKDISFSVRKGEVFGLAGLVGAGRTETVEAIFGLDPVEPQGQVLMHGKRIDTSSPRKSIRSGIAFIPEDRKIKGFIPGGTINSNIVLTKIMDLGRTFLVNTKLVRKLADEQRESLQIKALSYGTRVRELSGGNQQKVVLGKWLMRDDIEVMLMDEPTRGIDVGVKTEVYNLINRLAESGKSNILVTSEMPELIGMCDRIATLAEGRLTGILERSEFSQERIMHLCV